MEERLTRLLLTYKDLLPKDAEGSAIYPEDDAEIAATYVYTKENVNRLRVDVDLHLHNLRKGFVKFRMSQSDLVQTWIRKHAQLECLNDVEIT